MISVLHSVPFTVMVYRADIIRLRQGPDHIYLRTNLPNPWWPCVGTLSIRFATTRGNGRQWIKENIKGNIEVTEADLENLPANNGGSSSPTLGIDVTVA